MFANNLPKKWQLPYPDVPNNGAQDPQADRQRCQRHLPVAEETVIALGDGSLTRKVTDRKTKVVPQLSLSFV